MLSVLYFVSQFGVQAQGPQAKAVRTYGLAVTCTSTQVSGLAALRTSTQVSGLAATCTSTQVSGLAATHTSTGETGSLQHTLQVSGLAATQQGKRACWNTHFNKGNKSGWRSVVHVTLALNNGYSGEDATRPNSTSDVAAAEVFSGV